MHARMAVHSSAAHWPWRLVNMALHPPPHRSTARCTARMPLPHLRQGHQLVEVVRRQRIRIVPKQAAVDDLRQRPLQLIHVHALHAAMPRHATPRRHDRNANRGRQRG